MNIQTLALQAEQIVKEFEAGNITSDEYKELVQNLNFVQAVYSETANLEQNILYRNAIVAAINIAAALG